jgi:type IV secretory pathway VirB2 component (pilin)
MNTKLLIKNAATSVSLTFLLAAQAHAQGVDVGDIGGEGGSEKWYSFIVEGLEVVSEGVGAIVAVFLGLGLAGWGAWGAIKGRLEPERGLIMVIGGVIAVAAPSIASGLLSFIQD